MSFCCDKFKEETEYYWNGEYRGNWIEREEWNYCPHCGKRIK